MSRQFHGEHLPDWVLEPNYEHEIIPVGYVFQKSKVVPGPSESEQYQRLSLTMNGVLPRSREATDGIQPENFDGYQLIKPGQLIFKLIDLQNVSTSRVGLSEDLGLVSPAYIALTADRRVLPKYAYWYFMDLYNRRIFNNLSEGGVRANLSWEGLRQLPFILPSIERQRHIVEFLDAELEQIDALTAEQERLVSLLIERRAAVAEELVSRADSKEVRNRGIFRHVDRKSKTGEEELLSVSHITGVTPRSEKNVTMFEAESKIGYNLVEPGELVINTMWAWMGALGVSDFEGIVSPSYDIYEFIDRGEFCPEYFDMLYRTDRYIGLMKAHSRGIWESRLRLYPDVFLSLTSPVPSLKAQQQIAHEYRVKCAETDELLLKVQSLTSLLEERKQALITAAVTGELEV